MGTLLLHYISLIFCSKRHLLLRKCEPCSELPYNISNMIPISLKTLVMQICHRTLDTNPIKMVILMLNKDILDTGPWPN